LRPFALKVPTFLPPDWNKALANVLQNAITCNEWEDEVCDVAFYFVMVHGMGNFADLSLAQIMDLYSPHCLALALAIFWITEDRRILDSLMALAQQNRDSSAGNAFAVFVAILYVGRRPVSAAAVINAVRFSSKAIEQRFSRHSLDDRLMLAFLFHFLAANRQFEQTKFCRDIRGVLIKAQALTDPDPPCNFTSIFHKRFFTSQIPWICTDWKSLITQLIQLIE
jgi:hypothetical protein